MSGKIELSIRQHRLRFVKTRFVQARRLFVWPLLLLTLLLISGCMAPVSAIDARPTLIIDTDPLPVIAVAPVVGRPGTTVFVSGAGWQPDTAVFINLAVDEDLEDDENELLEVTVSASTVAADSRFAASFLYPYDPPWSDLEEVTIVAYSQESGDRAEAPFSLVPDSALTATVTPSTTVTATNTASVTPVATLTPTPSEAGYGSATVISDGLNVRTGPSTAYPVIRQLKRGATMAVLGQSEDTYWLYVQLPDGLLGWVAKNYTDYRGSPPVVKPTGVPSPPVATPAPPPMASRWVGEYFNNVNLSGEPALVRQDYSLNFNWGYGSPAPQIQNNFFSARWTQRVYFPGGVFRFFADPDDGVRIYVDDVLIIDQWHVSSGVVYTADHALARGMHTVRVEYFEQTQLASIRVWWDRSDGMVYPGWKGEYYNNMELSGAPSLVRNDAAIDFNWGYGSPASNIRPDYFSVRWSRTVYLDADRYRFYARMDDGMRVYLDGNLIIDEWSNGSARDVAVDRDVPAGYHNFVVEYYEHIELAEAVFGWHRIGGSSPPDSFPDWKGQYWSNRTLSGDPTLVRNDRRIDFNWGTGSPASSIPSDNFSARWTRRYDFSDGWYRFSARSDDGVRVWVDGDLIIDEWHDSIGNITYTADKYLDSKVDLKVEYYERYGGAAIVVDWDKISSPTKTPTPTSTSTTPTPTPTSSKTPTPDVTRSPYAKIQPDSGLPGTSIVVSGGGFPGNTTVNILLASPVRSSSASNAKIYASTQSDGSGNYSVLVTLPSSWPDGSPIQAGELLIIAATPGNTVTASAVFEVSTPRPTVAADPYLQLQPRSGGPGTTVVASGGGFPSNTSISIYLGGLVSAASSSAQPKVYASGPSDANGNYRISFLLPSNWPDGSAIETGKLNVVAATSGFSQQASTLFDFNSGGSSNPSVRISPTSGGAGTVVTVNGDGYPANKSVNIYLGTFDQSVGSGNPFLYGTAKTDISGQFSTAISMPAVWPDGAPVANGDLAVWVRSSDSSVQQSAIFSYTGASPSTPTNTPTPADTPAVPPTPTPNPKAGVSPSSGGGGTQVIVTGGGFPVDTTVNALISLFDANGGSGDAEIYGTTTTNANGDYSMSFTMPSTLPNGQPAASGMVMIVVATSDYRASASAPFDYTGVAAAEEVVPLTPSPEPTIAPSPIPSPEVSPEASPELTPDVTPEVDETPVLEETSTIEPEEEAPTQEPPAQEATEEVVEEVTEVATDEAEATPEPAVEPTDEPTEATPEPEPVVEPTDEPVEAAPEPEVPVDPTEAPVEEDPAPAPPVEEPVAESSAEPVSPPPAEEPVPVEPAPAEEAPAPPVEEAAPEPPAESEPVSPPPVEEPVPVEPAPVEEAPAPPVEEAAPEPPAESEPVSPPPAEEPVPVEPAPAEEAPAPPVEEAAPEPPAESESVSPPPVEEQSPVEPAPVEEAPAPPPVEEPAPVSDPPVEEPAPPAEPEPVPAIPEPEPVAAEQSAPAPAPVPPAEEAPAPAPLAPTPEPEPEATSPDEAGSLNSGE